MEGHLPNPNQEVTMRPLRRHPTNKRRSAAQFRSKTRRTKGANVAGPMRGGIRF